MSEDQELLSLLQEMTESIKSIQGEHNALRAMVISMMNTHPNLDSVRSIFVAQMNDFYSSCLWSSSQTEREERLKIWHTLLFLLDDAIQKRDDGSQRIE